MAMSRRDLLKEMLRRPTGELAGLLMPGGLKRALGFEEPAKVVSPEEAGLALAQRGKTEGEPEVWDVRPTRGGKDLGAAEEDTGNRIVPTADQHEAGNQFAGSPRSNTWDC